MKTWAMLFCLLWWGGGFALRVSEIYYGGDILIPDTERYIEIENDETNIIDLRQLTLVLPRSDTATVSNTLAAGNFVLFENEARTNAWTLQPGERVVVISEDYNLGGRLLSWDTNTILLKPKSKTSWTYSWNGRLPMIRLLYAGREVFSAADMPPSIQEKGKALCWQNGWVLDLPRPGQNKHVRFVGPRVAATGDMIFLQIESDGEASSVTIEEYPSGKTWTYPLQGLPPYRITLPGSMTHASTWIVRCGESSHKIRFLDTSLSSPWAGKVLISEIMSRPWKDYSGGGWTGEDGGGTINENDEWIELANLTQTEVDLFSWYIEHTTPQGQSYRRLKLRFDSRQGAVSTNLLSPHGLGIVSVENGLANKARLVLYDGHPLWGRRVASLWYGEGDVPSPAGTSREETLQRLPHNAPENRARWRLAPPTYGRINGEGPYLVHHWSDADPCLLEVIMSDPDHETGSLVLQARSEVDEVEVPLEGQDGCFYGTLRVGKTKPSGGLQVKNGGKNLLIYAPLEQRGIWEFFWREKGWDFPHTGEKVQDIVVYPNPAPRGGRVFLTGIVKGATVVIFDSDGRVVEKYMSHGEEWLVWKVPDTSGLYCVLVSSGGKSTYRWLLIR